MAITVVSLPTLILEFLSKKDIFLYFHQQGDGNNRATKQDGTKAPLVMLQGMSVCVKKKRISRIHGNLSYLGSVGLWLFKSMKKIAYSD